MFGKLLKKCILEAVAFRNKKVLIHLPIKSNIRKGLDSLKLFLCPEMAWEVKNAQTFLQNKPQNAKASQGNVEYLILGKVQVDRVFVQMESSPIWG